jgi:hypothetical protein
MAAPQFSPGAQTSNAPLATGPYSISGTVVSAAGGNPLDRAEVTLSSINQQGAPGSEVLTTETGNFRFDHLAAGKYTLRADRRGYIAGGYQEHENFETAIVTGPNLDSQNISLALFPESIIGGVITDDSGDPVGGARVALYRQDNYTGESRMNRARTETTDDTGTYEFSRLRPGTYYLSVSARPWYSFQPSPKSDATGNPLPDDQQPHSPLDVAYPITFYPNATDSASASPIVLMKGDPVEANLSLHAVPAIHIQIHIPQPTPGRNMAIPQLTTDVFGTEQGEQSAQFIMTGRGGNMIADLGGVAPGHYTLREFGRDGEVRGPTVDLTTSQTIDFTPTAASVDVSGKLAMASGQKLPAGMFASLFSANSRTLDAFARVAPDGTFDFHSVIPGTYELQVQENGRALAVAQIAASGAEVHGTRFTVAADPVLLAATLVTGATTVTGYAQSNGKGIGGVMILLAPLDPNAGSGLYRRDQSDSDGSFSLNRVIPGAYTLVAIQDGWTLDWAHPEVVAPYLARGLKLQVSGQQKTLALPEPLVIQSR